jgi:hypothetical protein
MEVKWMARALANPTDEADCIAKGSLAKAFFRMFSPLLSN